MTNTRRRRSSRFFLTGAVALLALTVTGCGSDSGGVEVASASNDGGSSSGDKSDGLKSIKDRYLAKKQKYVDCLRKNGLEKVPDPDSKGRIDFAQVGSAGQLKQDPTFLRAQKKCADLNPPVPQKLEKAMVPDLSEEEIAERKEFAKCMQENGVPSYPSPDKDGWYDDEDLMSLDQSSPEFKRARRICGDPADHPSVPPNERRG